MKTAMKTVSKPRRSATKIVKPAPKERPKGRSSSTVRTKVTHPPTMVENAFWGFLWGVARIVAPIVLIPLGIAALLIVIGPVWLKAMMVGAILFVFWANLKWVLLIAIVAACLRRFRKST